MSTPRLEANVQGLRLACTSAFSNGSNLEDGCVRGGDNQVLKLRYVAKVGTYVAFENRGFSEAVIFSFSHQCMSISRKADRERILGNGIAGGNEALSERIWLSQSSFLAVDVR